MIKRGIKIEKNFVENVMRAFKEQEQKGLIKTVPYEWLQDMDDSYIPDDWEEELERAELEKEALERDAYISRFLNMNELSGYNTVRLGMLGLDELKNMYGEGDYQYA